MGIYDGILIPPTENFNSVRDGRRTPVRHYDIDLSTARSITAGTAATLEFASDFFLADVDPVNQGDAVVHFQDTQLDRVSAPVYVTRGFKGNMPYTRLLIENAAQPGKRLRFFYGVDLDLEPGGNNVTVAGSVEVIDGGRARTLVNAAFEGALSVGPSVGNVSVNQVWNPLGSGKRIVIKAYQVGMGVAGLLKVGIVGDGTNSARAANTSGTMASKLNGSLAFGAAELRWQTTAAGIIVTSQKTPLLPANQSVPFTLQEPVVLYPGFGFNVESAAANVQVVSSVETVEETL